MMIPYLIKSKYAKQIKNLKDIVGNFEDIKKEDIVKLLRSDQIHE